LQGVEASKNISHVSQGLPKFGPGAFGWGLENSFSLIWLEI